MASEHRDDPIYRSSLRESLVALASWTVCALYTLVYCSVMAYDQDPDRIDTIWGIPEWVAYGVFLPWVAVNVFAWWFCFRFIRDEDLEGEATSDEKGARHADGAR